MSTNMFAETYEKICSLTSAREVWLKLHYLFDGVHEDKSYDLHMQFFGYKMNQTDDIATHIGKLKNIWKDLKVELDKTTIRLCCLFILLKHCQVSIFHLPQVGDS